MFDSHCHLDFDAYDGDRADVLARARAAGVTAIHVPGVSPDGWSRAAALCRDDESLGFSVGVHPWWIARLDALSADDLVEAAARLGAEAIGECGLDRSLEKRGGPSLDEQARMLELHLEAARSRQLPIVLHVLGAHGRALDVLRRHGPLPRGGMLHSYSGPADMISAYAKLGLRFSFCGVVTRERAKKTHAAVRAVPADRLLLETDGPDQPLEGRDRSEPGDLVVTCGAVARLRGEPEEVVANRTRANAIELFAR